MDNEKGQGFLILDRSEFATEWEYQAAIEAWLREKKNPPLRKYTDERTEEHNG